MQLSALQLSLVNLHEGCIDGVSNIARISEFEQCHVKDVVLIKYGNDFIAGEVWLHAAVSGQTYSIVSFWSLNMLDKEHRCALWLKSENSVVLKADTIICSVIWESLDHNVVKTLVPTKLF